MKRNFILKLGRPTHFLRRNGFPACGLNSGIAKSEGAYDPRDVDCLNCMRTKMWKQMMGKRVKTVRTNIMFL